ncbi:OmpA family protein [Cellulophaga sp. E16_2]|uniref:OmpA family protein n=1 Tax=Cellulophaga sp. E16_2 TaxID=2789297 RepID=UPI001A931312|nr:OmpA family protein [Cellulophaga sp. E16_2]MBO0590903.1 OmpA family protein [Cellulophaga sp. E16_2]
MKKIILLTAMTLSLFSCKDDPKVTPQLEQETETIPIQETDREEPLIVFKEFDWSSIPVSDTNIGVFPYLTAPEGFIIWEDGHNDVAKNGMTNYFDYNKLIMYTGTSFFNADGKKAELDFAMSDRTIEFEQYKFDQNIDHYLKSIGAQLIFKGQIPREKIEDLNKEDDKTVFKYIQGDPYNSSPVKHYVLNHVNGKITFQVWSNSARAEIGVVKLEDFNQTIKAPTASEMKSDIDKTGKAILNINFDTDKATLKPDGETLVAEIFTLLNENDSLKLSIEGHTDSSGNVERNKQLSMDRANTVLYTLAGKGIAINRLTAKGFGAKNPILSNETEENKAKNRRVELVKI